MTEKELIESGNMKIEWARTHMPVLAIVREKFEKEKPLKELKIGMALHVEAKTAVLVAVSYTHLTLPTNREV